MNNYLGYRGDPQDNRAVFDFVAAHLLRQRRKSERQVTS
jgi:hypothetical protein